MLTDSPRAPAGALSCSQFGVRVDSPVRTVVLHGELDAATVPILVDSVLPAVSALARGDVELDVSAVTFLDAAALGAFARLHAQQVSYGHGLVVTGADDDLRRVFVAGGMLELMA
jgi:anti-anti-sigma factor